EKSGRKVRYRRFSPVYQWCLEKTGYILGVIRKINLSTTPMEIIKNNKGSSKLCAEGYLYTKKSSNSTRIRWECSRRKALSCKGCAHTDLELKQLLSVTEHSHDTDPNKVKAAKVKNTIKACVLINRGRPPNIVADAICEQLLEVRCAIGRLDSVKLNVRRAMPRDPTSLRELEHISDDWTTAGAPENHEFLIYDNGPESRDRVIVFATDQGLKHLSRSTTWFIDGTFAAAPRLFQQLYVIRAPLGPSAVTCVYAFLSAKSQTIYEEFLQAICDKGDNLGFNPDPSTVMTGFERAMINAKTTILGPHVSTRGCFYHLTLSTWRKVQSLGLTAAYRNNDRVKHFCGMLDGLAFLPIDEVTNGMYYLLENIPDVNGLEDLVDYF
ncbi:putative Inosine-5'-monophosphate dehydrogenase 1b-like 16, partial [Homarus americanus]